MVELVVIGVAALLTSVLSAVAGLGGGVVLLLVIAQFVAPTTAIPIQGAIQLVSNGSRAVLLRSSISWSVVGWSSILVLPASLVGVLIATSIPDDAVRIVLAVFVLVLAWRPDWLRLPAASAIPAEGRRDTDPNAGLPDTPAPMGTRRKRPMLLGIGAVSGLLNTTVGASGPVTSPLYKAVTAGHVAFVATAAATQIAAHVAKLVSFASRGWDPSDHVATIAVGVVGVVVGSNVGTRLLGRLDEARVDTVFRVVLTVLAVRLFVSALA